MRKTLLLLLLNCCAIFANSMLPDTLVSRASVLVIPYMPDMHLSDADPDIAIGSEMEFPEMRSELRKGLVSALNKNFQEVYDVPGLQKDFAGQSERDIEILYHSLLYQSDSVYTLKDPKRFALVDSLGKKIKPRKETTYINISIADEMLIPDYSKKYNADYFIFLNELDIKTNYDDCLNLALKIYRRDLKVHYSIFIKSGKQIYGDVAVASFDTNTNDVKEINGKYFPVIAEYILSSFDKAVK